VEGLNARIRDLRAENNRLRNKLEDLDNASDVSMDRKEKMIAIALELQLHDMKLRFKEQLRSLLLDKAEALQSRCRLLHDLQK
jgi:hypothetical protein